MRRSKQTNEQQLEKLLRLILLIKFIEFDCLLSHETTRFRFEARKNKNTFRTTQYTASRIVW